MNFVAIDFETADHGRDSACQIGVAKIVNGLPVSVTSRLIQPPRSLFKFTQIHGITWQMVEREPIFRDLWPTLAPLLVGAEYLVAHNAGFDKSVMNACCQAAGLPIPDLDWKCSLQLSRKKFPGECNKLPSVVTRTSIALREASAHFGFADKFHDAGTDALAAAMVWMALQ